MKGKVLTLIIGILIGAVLTAGGFLIYNKVTGGNNQAMPEAMQQDGNGNGQGMAKPDGNSTEEPPTKPDGNSMEEPPAKPDGDDNNSNATKQETSNNETSSNS